MEGSHCEHGAIKPGETIPEEWGGGVNKWPWPIPRLAKNVPTKPELVGHYAPESPDFNLRVPDQIRAEMEKLNGGQGAAAGTGNGAIPPLPTAPAPRRSTPPLTSHCRRG